MTNLIPYSAHTPHPMCAAWDYANINAQAFSYIAGALSSAFNLYSLVAQNFNPRFENTAQSPIIEIMKSKVLMGLLVLPSVSEYAYQGVCFKEDDQTQMRMVAISKIIKELVESSSDEQLKPSRQILEKNFEMIYEGLAIQRPPDQLLKAAKLYLKNFFPNEQKMQNDANYSFAEIQILISSLIQKKNLLDKMNAKLADLWCKLCEC